jgi:hypothetical protein
VGAADTRSIIARVSISGRLELDAAMNGWTIPFRRPDVSMDGFLATLRGPILNCYRAGLARYVDYPTQFRRFRGVETIARLALLTNRYKIQVITV